MLLVDMSTQSEVLKEILEKAESFDKIKESNRKRANKFYQKNKKRVLIKLKEKREKENLQENT